VASVAIGLAAASGAHALSSASLRNDPEVAASIWPANGRAKEKIAYLTFVKQVRAGLGQPEASVNGQADRLPKNANANVLAAPAGLRPYATEVSRLAAEALRHEPLLPKAHAILALSQSEPSRQARIVELASHLDRRELALQGLVLGSKVEARDYDGMIAVIDQILRVNPERGTEFFPVLTTALRQKATIPSFRELLVKPLPWKDGFLMQAVQDPIAAKNFVIIRQSVAIGTPDFNRSLIATLVSNGDVVTAESLYLQLTKQRAVGKGGGWSSDFPPFDWTFADEAGMRAQPDREGDNLEFSVDPGEGGALASRLFSRPRTPFLLQAKPNLAAGSSAKDLKIKLFCLGDADPFLEASFADRLDAFVVREVPKCDYITLALSGRAWSGSAPLNGSFSRVTISPR
jgi:hypothetical protein